ncbi:hypothetical protein DDE18_17580 [Nocardioides gansuensis]|uniref:Peptidase M10 metallopeptidase domain-containing protein n=1 Tax=Nocardioides gansuensis TaxID=2138300 RepID=A0A2T8F7T2_9ACTN|nr:matrixin family metalloprotease [Nocardioides gansuensis]PVG81778.1 hypothetical protein DDE18_17580 [Nocardioides gansuensis]
MTEPPPSERERLRRARELEEAMRELDRLDREHGLGAMPGTTGPGLTTPEARPRGAGSSPVLVGLVVVGVVLAGLLALRPGGDLMTVARMLGIAPEIYANPPEFTPGQGEFRFLRTQSGRAGSADGEPVGYDPCTPIEYAVNPAGAPDGWSELIETGIEHTEWATGLDFQYVGETELRPFNDLQHDFIAAKDQPVVIGFGDASEFPGLADDVAGIGGSVAFTGGGAGPGRTYFTTGSIALDVDIFTDDAHPAELQAIVDHELGHVVGLDHVDSPAELMHATNLGRTTYGEGDLEGLARLGSLPCR